MIGLVIGYVAAGAMGGQTPTGDEELVAQIEELQGQIDEYESEISNLKSEIDDLEADLAAANEEEPISGDLFISGSSTVFPIADLAAEDFYFEELGETVKNCLSSSIEYLETMDKDAIFELSKIEAESDELYRKNLEQLWESQLPIKTVMAYTLTIRYLERIADHSSYISEAIYYAITGRRISLR